MPRQNKFLISQFLTVLLFAGCGGGSVQISNFREGGTLRPPGKVIELLESTSDAELGGKVQELHGKLGENLNWQGFWTQLALSKVKDRLIPAHQTELLSLQALSCDVHAFGAYAQFIINVKSGWEFLMGPKRECLTSLDSVTAMKLFRIYYQSNAERSTDPLVAQQTLTLLTRQMEHEPGALWDSLFTSTDSSWLRKVITTNLASDDPQASLQFAQTYLQITDELPFADLYGEKFFKSPEFLTHLFEKNGPVKTIRMFADIALQPANGSWTLSEDELTRVENILGTQGLLAAPTLEEGWTTYLYLRRSLANLYAGKEEVAKLQLNERLENQVESFFKGKATNDVGNFIEGKLKSATSSSSQAELSWLSFRLFNTNGNALLALAAEKVAALETTPLSSLVDRVLVGRLAIHFAANMKEKSKKAEHFCSLLEDNGVESPNTPISVDAFLQALSSEKPKPGCFTVHSDTETVQGESLKPLSASHDSFYKISAARVAFKAPRVDLGILDLSATKIHPLPAKLPTPHDFDAMTLPLLVGINISAQPNQGAHFFILHMPVRSAKNGPVDTRAAEAGVAGGNLEITASSPPAPYSLIALGGPGQKAAPASDGGKGDSSAPKQAKLTQFVVDYEASGVDNVSLQSPYIFHPELSAGWVRDLLNRGDRNAAGSLLMFIHPDFSSSLPIEDQAKLQKYCATMAVPSPTPAQIASCVQQKLLVPIFQRMTTELNRMQQSTTFQFSDIMEATSILNPFTLPSGLPGTPGAEGAPGTDGAGSFTQIGG